MEIDDTKTKLKPVLYGIIQHVVSRQIAFAQCISDFGAPVLAATLSLTNKFPKISPWAEKQAIDIVVLNVARLRHHDHIELLDFR